MSERKGDDAVRVPIEIRTEDLSELQQLIQQLTEAEEASRTARASGAALPSKGAAGPQTFGGQAKRTAREGAEGEGAGGIFAGVRDKDALPMSFRDRSGSQAMQRESPFDALQNQVKDLAEEQAEQTMSMMDQVMGMGMAYVPWIGGHKAIGMAQMAIKNKMKQRAANKAQQAAGAGFAGMGGAGMPVPVGAGMGGGAKIGAILGKVRMVAARGGPIGAAVAIAITAIMLTKEYIDWTHSPGGPNDLRYRRVISDEMNPLIEREKKQEINIGTRVVRVTSAPAVRDPNQVHSTYERVKRGIPIYNGEFEAYAKGLFLGGSGP